VGSTGRVVGVDMTDEQRAKAECLRNAAGFSKVEYRKGYIEAIPCGEAEFDVVISNGVINRSPDKEQVFSRSGPRALSDIVTAVQLPPTIVCNSTLWAACVGGAMQRNDYRQVIEAAGLNIECIIDNDSYQFISDWAKGASRKFGAKSVSLLAVKE
jgi:arsenite methyltransferase